VGFEPQLDVCVVCGRSIDADEPVRFDSVAGGVACTRCRPVGRLLDPATRSEVRAMIAGRALEVLEHPATHRALLRAFVNAQISHDRPLRSLELFAQGDLSEEPPKEFGQD
jgi:recombinational DNA repair protein (RecF pathway)